MRTISWRVGLAAGLVVLAGPALAHHPMGGTTPATFIHGLLSGIGHPVIGFDHFAFVIAVGLVAAMYRAAYALPVAFLAGMVGGVIVHLGALNLPIVEVTIALSVVVLGIWRFGRRPFPSWPPGSSLRSPESSTAMLMAKLSSAPKRHP